MTTKPGLRAVRDDETAPKNADRELLVAMRERIRTAVFDPKTSPRDLAALSRRVQELTKDIASIDALDAPPTPRSNESVNNTYDPAAI